MAAIQGPVICFSPNVPPSPVPPPHSLSPSSLRNPSFRRPIASNTSIRAAADDSLGSSPRSAAAEGLLSELAKRERSVFPRKKDAPPPRFILKPPLDDARIADRFLNTPQLSLKSFPLLSSCLPLARLNSADKRWIDEYLHEAKQAIGCPLDPPSGGLGDDNPANQFDTLLYLAFQHPQDGCERSRSRHVSNGHSRLSFLGQFVVEIALAEYLLQRFPREPPAPMKERVYLLTGKRFLHNWIEAAGLHNLVFPFDEIEKMKRKEREPPVKSVFSALLGAIYLCFGMSEVYRVLFEVFGMDPNDKNCQPRPRRQLEDIDFVPVEFDNRELHWQDFVSYKPPEDALFAHPRLFRVCVPLGMHRFRGNIWDFDNRAKVMQALGYPLPTTTDRYPDITEARNIELGLGLQLCFLHPSKFKFEHPRFCYERLEYVGQKIQDLVMAERLLMKHLDAHGSWLQEKHRRLMMNKNCGRYLRDRRLHGFIIYGDSVEEKFNRHKWLRNTGHTAVQQALHGLAYAVYGKRDVWRLMFEVFDFEKVQPQPV